MEISIFKFLAMYYGITLDAGTECTHTDAKMNFTFLNGCSFRCALENPDLVRRGKIIYVADSHGVVFPYICPNEVVVSDKDCEYTKKETEKNSDDKSILDELDEMPTYIVHELLSKYKNRPSFYRIIKKELIKRGEYKNKNYRLRKEINHIELEEGENNDKYQRRRKIKCKKS